MEKIYEQVLNLYNTEELWDWIPGFENKYQISTYGRVKSYAGNNHGIILMPKITKAGYWYIHLSQKGDKPRVKTIGISRMVAAVFLPNPEDLAEVDHIDNQKWNNHISNLQWIEHDKNVRKDQAYLYKFWNDCDPDEILWAESKRQIENIIGKSHGWLTYHIKRNSFPTRDGWNCQVSRIKGSEKKKW
jgi:hypothetical protein